MMRIHIIGPPGSGKTTLAQRLASSLQLPFYDLDYIAWEAGYPGTERPLEIRLRDILHIATQPAWITEGVFLTWTDELLSSADCIVWLDVPIHLVLKHTLSRRLRSDFGGTIPPTNLLKQFRFLTYIGKYYYSKKHTETRWFTANCLLVHQHKLAHCRTLPEIEALLKSILEQHQAER
jgi:adenylate kinase family enzyme